MGLMVKLRYIQVRLLVLSLKAVVSSLSIDVSIMLIHLPTGIRTIHGDELPKKPNDTFVKANIVLQRVESQCIYTWYKGGYFRAKYGYNNSIIYYYKLYSNKVWSVYDRRYLVL